MRKFVFICLFVFLSVVDVFADCCIEDPAAIADMEAAMSIWLNPNLPISQRGSSAGIFCIDGCPSWSTVSSRTYVTIRQQGTYPNKQYAFCYKTPAQCEEPEEPEYKIIQIGFCSQGSGEQVFIKYMGCDDDTASFSGYLDQGVEVSFQGVSTCSNGGGGDGAISWVRYNGGCVPKSSIDSACAALSSAVCDPAPDQDGDGIPDIDDPDDDNDGIPDSDDPDKKDSDGDGIPDSQDPDDDNDGLPDDLDNDADKDSDGDGVPDSKDSDKDGDGIADVNDPDFMDSDKDGIKDSQDTDDDNDGIPDSQDSDPFNKNNPKDNDNDDSDNPSDYDNSKDNDNDDSDNPSNNIDLSGTNRILSEIEDNTDGIEGELKHLNVNTDGASNKLGMIEDNTDGIEGELKQLNNNTDGASNKLQEIDNNTDGIEGALSQLNNNTDGASNKLQEIDNNTDGIEGALDSVISGIGDTNTGLGNIETKLDTAITGLNDINDSVASLATKEDLETWRNDDRTDAQSGVDDINNLDVDSHYNEDKFKKTLEKDVDYVEPPDLIDEPFLESFFNSNPLLSAFSGTEFDLQSSTCSLSFSLPGLGGSYEFSLCEYQSSFNQAGNILLAFCSILTLLSFVRK